MMTDAQREKIEKGIAAYSHEQAVILRLLKRKGSFTAKDFDRWFYNREWKPLAPLGRRTIGRGITGETFILGIGQNGLSYWAEMLDLIQHMMRLDLVDATTEGGLVVYRLGPQATVKGH